MAGLIVRKLGPLEKYSNFFGHVYHCGYTLDEPNRSLRDFFDKDECGTEAANNLIKTIWVIVNAETVVKEEVKRN